MSEKYEYFFSSLDAHLHAGKSPTEALQAAVEDYAFVWHPPAHDGRTPLSRAARRALDMLEGQQPQGQIETINKPRGDCLSIWRWEQAPDYLKKYSTHGGDEDWLLFCPKHLVYAYWPLGLGEAIAENKLSWLDGWKHVDRHRMADGSVVIIFAHA